MSSISNAPAAGPAKWSRWILVGSLALAVAVLLPSLWLAGGLVREARAAAREHDFWTLCQPGSTPGERQDAFRRLVAAGNREWRSADLRALDLSGMAADGADLHGASFLRTRLVGAHLEVAQLGSCILELADLSGAQLAQSNLREARLVQAVLRGAVLRRVNLSAGSIEQVQAEGADFALADLSDADCLMANLTRANLTGVNFSGAKLESAILKGANLSLARFEGADVSDTDFSQANWWRARGFTTRQLEVLKRKFAPGPEADPALRADYARWSGEAEPR